MQLSNKIALVTGGGKGIGKAIAEGFAKAGATVILNELHGATYVEAVANDIILRGGKAEVYYADMSKVADIRAMFQHIQLIHKRLDILVNNAGITGWSDFFDTDETLFDTVINLNIKGTLFCRPTRFSKKGTEFRLRRPRSKVRFTLSHCCSPGDCHVPQRPSLDPDGNLGS